MIYVCKYRSGEEDYSFPSLNSNKVSKSHKYLQQILHYASTTMSEGEYKERDYTLIFCRRTNSDGQREILLGMKKRGFGVGKWNGFGGKVEEGESIEQGAIRELEEESSIKTSNLKRLGYLVFKLLDVLKVMRVHVYETWDFEGTSVESEEMRPKWYLESDIPYSTMWADDQYWLPLLLEGKSFIGRFEYEDEDTITDYSVKVQ